MLLNFMGSKLPPFLSILSLNKTLLAAVSVSIAENLMTDSHDALPSVSTVLLSTSLLVTYVRSSVGR